jgi:hypothetical protein
LPEIVRQWRAEVVSIQVETTREFIEGFEATPNDDEEWAAKYLRGAKERESDREGIYVRVMDREAARAKKGLPPRVTFLANWDSGDEERYDDARVRKREQLARKGKPKASKGSKDAVVRQGHCDPPL